MNRIIWNCPICLDGMTNFRITLLECGHAFHANCVETAIKWVIYGNVVILRTHWFYTVSFYSTTGRNLCPVCRATIEGTITLNNIQQQPNSLLCATCRENVLDRIFDNQVVCVLNCGHLFHYSCLHSCVKNGPWMSGYVFRTCPLCHLRSDQETTIFDLSG